MNRFAIVIVFSLVPLAARAQGEQTPAALIQAWTKSWNTYDLREVRRLFVSDSTVTYFSSERRGFIRGIDSLVAHHRRFGFVEGGKSSPNKLWLTHTVFRKGWVAATWHFQRPGSVPQLGPVTFVLATDGSTWKIQHAHFSNDPVKP